MSTKMKNKNQPITPAQQKARALAAQRRAQSDTARRSGTVVGRGNVQATRAVNNWRNAGDYPERRDLISQILQVHAEGEFDNADLAMTPEEITLWRNARVNGNGFLTRHAMPWSTDDGAQFIEVITYEADGDMNNRPGTLIRLMPEESYLSDVGIYDVYPDGVLVPSKAKPRDTYRMLVHKSLEELAEELNNADDDDFVIKNGYEEDKDTGEFLHFFLMIEDPIAGVTKVARTERPFSQTEVVEFAEQYNAMRKEIAAGNFSA